MLDDDVREVQRLYPQIYMACHVDHVRSASTEFQLSSYDSSILAHLELRKGMSPRQLAAHLGVAASTLSAAIARLVRLGYVENAIEGKDKRRRQLRLTSRGLDAMAATSVLDCDRVRALLENLSTTERRAAVRGLALLGAAARRMKEPS